MLKIKLYRKNIYLLSIFNRCFIRLCGDRDLTFIISHIFLGRRKEKGWRGQTSLDIGVLYLPLVGLSLPLYLEVVATFGIHYFP
jgi:hypothetical protein